MPKGEKQRKLSDEQRLSIVRDYLTPLPDGTWAGSKLIAPRYGVSYRTVYYVLQRAGVQTRNKRESHAHGKRCKPIKNLPAGEPPQCKCGCGQSVDWNRRKNRWNMYVVGHYRLDSPVKDAEWLRHAHIEQGLTVEQIADSQHVSRRIVSYWMVQHGIPLQSAYRGSPGARNGAWKGGVTPERQRLYKAGHWRQFSQSIYERDGFLCQRCHSSKKQRRGLHAHHLKSWADNPALRFDPANLVTLCHKCHKFVHSSANVNREFIQ